MKTSPNNVQLFPALTMLCAITLVGLMASSANAQETNEIQWLTNIDQATKVAKQQDKLILMHFHADWSRPCKALDTFVFRSGFVKQAIAENVIPVMIDADQALNLVNEYEVAMVPFDVVITPDGRVVSERRSPSDAENYAKMIAGAASTSQSLDSGKMEQIAQMRQVVKNRSLQGPKSPTDFRVDGSFVEHVALSKKGNASSMQRRQTASAENNSVTKTNPFVGQASNESSFQLAASDNNSVDSVSVQDLERDKFLSRKRDWVAPSMETRRAKPQRIVNDRYFEAISEKQAPVQVASTGGAKPAPFSLASSSREVTLEPDTDAGFDLQLDSHTATASHSDALPLNGSDFKVQPTTPGTDTAPSIGLADLEPKTPLLDRHKVSLKGKCPVTLITEGRWVDGDSQFGIVHRNRTYIFASAEKLAEFRTAPDKYSPMLAGFDPVVYHEQGELVEGLVENGIFMGRTPEQKVVLFKDAATRSKFQASPKDYLETIRQATKSTKATMMR